MAPGVLKAMNRSHEVGVDDVSRVAAVTGMNAGLGGTFEEKVTGSRCFKICWAAHVTVNKIHTARFKASQRQFRSAPPKIVEGNNLDRMIALQCKRQSRTDKAGTAGDEDAGRDHGRSFDERSLRVHSDAAYQIYPRRVMSQHAVAIPS